MRKNEKPIPVYFKLYNEVSEQLESYKAIRGSMFGILAHTDYWARQYQGIVMRKEILKAHLEGRHPNWYHAPYLTNEERERRNKSYGNV